MLQMKIKKSVLPDTEKKQVFRCSRCGYYVEKQQVFGGTGKDERDSNLYPPYQRGGR